MSAFPPPAGCRRDRRRFLAGAAAVAVAQGLSGCAWLGWRRHGWVDAHAQVWTSDATAYPPAPGAAAARDRARPDFTVADLMAEARPHGVDRAVLVQPALYGFDNRYLLESIRLQPRMFRGVAAVDEKTPRMAEVIRHLARHGVRGLRHEAGRDAVDAWFGSGEMRGMWNCAADEGLAICLRTEPEALAGIRRMCRSHPGTRVVIEQFAGIGRDRPVQKRYLDELCRLSEFSRVYVKISGLHAMGKKSPPYTDLRGMIAKLHQVYDAERLMWGSDSPYQLQRGHGYGDSIALVRDRLDFLSGGERQWVLRKTAEKVFFS